MASEGPVERLIDAARHEALLDKAEAIRAKAIPRAAGIATFIMHSDDDYSDTVVRWVGDLSAWVARDTRNRGLAWIAESPEMALAGLGTVRARLEAPTEQQSPYPS